MPAEFKHIVRIAGKDLSGEKRVQLALADIKGVSAMMARAVAYAAKVDPMVKLGSLSKEEIERLEDVVSRPQAHGIPSWMFNRRKDDDTGKDIHLIGSDIDRAVRADIARERRIRSRRGIRHELGLPVRGQRTRSTGRKGMTVGVKRKEVRIREAEAAAKKGEAPPRKRGAPREKAAAKAEEKEEKKVEKKEEK
jgi:small subunit ribosomal protein S13